MSRCYICNFSPIEDSLSTPKAQPNHMQTHDLCAECCTSISETLFEFEYEDLDNAFLFEDKPALVDGTPPSKINAIEDGSLPALGHRSSATGVNLTVQPVPDVTAGDIASEKEDPPWSI